MDNENRSNGPAPAPEVATPIIHEPTQTKFCKHCGSKVDINAVVCIKCGLQIEELKTEQPQVVITNTNHQATPVYYGAHGRQKDKWVAALLCFFLGYLGVHRFYEGKIGTGILYLFTLGLFGIGIIVDLIIILCKPNPYYV